ncbi:6-phosphogluconolactonase [Parashewanella spongiae]|uniref:6-phosphogluconolactonase n=1 Tax=Parashewanella spongiae TaxID=342950 RepID=A0A3A6TZ70_9GAMM|nr:6-phosphogluconolactonase [Parashewanella spongiae]MCL1077532.1 6-phosphogluconolactonase [Parashewanella spongiae]RJY18272.1 6-phosphogluconolactonase [Parashewanella spongiae]
MKEAVFKSFDDANQLAEKLAEKIAGLLQEGIDTRGKASLVVSGGSTPITLFKLLSKKNIGWKDVYITLADERWVDSENKDSNENLVLQHLLQNKASSAKFTGLKNMFETAVEGCQMASEKLQHFPSKFDVVVLGMGNDGHTCSWFPCANRSSLEVALTTDTTCVAVTPTTAPHERITLTKQRILASRQVFLHLVGEQKLTVYRQVLENDDVYSMPIRAVLSQHKTPVDVYWSA